MLRQSVAEGDMTVDSMSESLIMREIDLTRKPPSREGQPTHFSEACESLAPPQLRACEIDRRCF
jgi:hypothetical protein